MPREDGFTNVPNWIILHPGISKTDMAVFLAIAMHADNDTRDCWPSYEKLMEVAGIKDRRTFIKHLKNLEAIGAVSIIKPFTRYNPHRSNRYFIHPAPPGQYEVDADGYHLVGDRRFED